VQSKDSNKRNTMQPMSDTEKTLEIPGFSVNFYGTAAERKNFKK
jgi:hypothetical protein